MAKEKRTPFSSETDQPEVAPQADVSALTKTESPTSHGMMWTISSPTGGVLALVRDEAAADMVLTALAAYVPPEPPPLDMPAGYMTEEEIIRRTEEAQANLRQAGQLCPLPPPVAPMPPAEPNYSDPENQRLA